MNKELLQQIKKETWLFSDEDIINEYNKMQTYDYLFDGMKQDPEYVVLFLYKDKGTLSKEEYTSEIMNYFLGEFYQDGVAILDYIVKHRKAVFPSTKTTWLVVNQ